MPDFMQRKVLFNDGEGVDHNDFNEFLFRIYQQQIDGILGPQCQIKEADDESGKPNENYLWAVMHGGAPYASAVALTSASAAGLVLQAKTAQGTEITDATTLQNLLPYWAEENDFGFLHTAATAGNHRYDLISCEITEIDTGSVSRDFKDAVTGALSTSTPDKQRRTAITITKTEGTEVAVASTPTIPALPAGHVRHSVFLVTENSVVFDPLANNDILDFRMPVGNLQCQNWSAAKIFPENTSNITVGQGGIMTATGIVLARGHVPNMGGGSRRIVRVAGEFMLASAVTTEHVILRRAIGTGIGGTDMFDLGTTLHSGSSDRYKESDLLTVGADFPLWATGFSSGYALTRQRVNDTASVERLTVEWSANNGDDCRSFWVYSVG